MQKFEFSVNCTELLGREEISTREATNYFQCGLISNI